MPASRPDGFTLAEVLVAIALLGAMAVGVTGLFNGVVAPSARSRDTLVGHLLATDGMEQCLDQGFASLAPGTTVEPDPAGYDGFSRRTTITTEKADLLRIKVWAGSSLGADSVETLLASR